MQLRHVINLHKGLTPLVVLGLMAAYGNFGNGPWLYLALHGTYGLLWLLKDRMFPDRQWEQTVGWPVALSGFLALGLYWLAPYLLISSGAVPPPPLAAAATALCLTGVFLHYGADAQKHFTLQQRPGLIDEGFFARCRNPNYLGEIGFWLSLALFGVAAAPQHWWWLFVGVVVMVRAPHHSATWPWRRRARRPGHRYPPPAATAPLLLLPTPTPHLRRPRPTRRRQPPWCGASSGRSTTWRSAPPPRPPPAGPCYPGWTTWRPSWGGGRPTTFCCPSPSPSSTTGTGACGLIFLGTRSGWPAWPGPRVWKPSCCPAWSRTWRMTSPPSSRRRWVS
jgi:protein-S-isoprenylcysteine O-methyltransferase Ste14